MIASGAVPALLPAHIGVSQTSSITAQSDFAGALRFSRTDFTSCTLPQLPHR